MVLETRVELGDRFGRLDEGDVAEYLAERPSLVLFVSNHALVAGVVAAHPRPRAR